jgi:two-component system phosphate regulon sensor histidine kinase PhoR
VAVFYDITEMDKVERLRRDFVANVSHELRTPLASIQGYSETLLDGALEDNDNNRRFLEIIRQNSVRLARLTSDLMTLAQIESNARGFLFAPHNVAKLVHLAADELRLITEKKSITVVVDPMPERLIAFFDSGAIHQVLVNLLDNAAKYTPEGGAITVGARVTEVDLVLYVRDTGIGIPPDHIPRLFERFYRVDTARSRAMGGTGLGLAIVKHIALAHNGSVRVESEPGKGSAFYFRIPLNLSGQTVSADADVEVLTAD